MSSIIHSQKLDHKKITPPLIELKPGKLLVSEPFLIDSEFHRTVILVCEHTTLGSTGYILNKLIDHDTEFAESESTEDNFPLYYGGPVQQNTLHYIHQLGHLIEGSIEIMDGIFWGGDINTVTELMTQKKISPGQMRFFFGCSGWSADQLMEEIADKVWWVTEATSDIIFDKDLDNMWKKIVKTLGDDYAYMANSPDDPSWN